MPPLTRSRARALEEKSGAEGAAIEAVIIENDIEEPEYPTLQQQYDNYVLSLPPGQRFIRSEHLYNINANIGEDMDLGGGGGDPRQRISGHVDLEENQAGPDVLDGSGERGALPGDEVGCVGAQRVVRNWTVRGAVMHTPPHLNDSESEDGALPGPGVPELDQVQEANRGGRFNPIDLAHAGQHGIGADPSLGGPPQLDQAPNQQAGAGADPRLDEQDPGGLPNEAAVEGKIQNVEDISHGQRTMMAYVDQRLESILKAFGNALVDRLDRILHSVGDSIIDDVHCTLVNHVADHFHAQQTFMVNGRRAVADRAARMAYANFFEPGSPFHELLMPEWRRSVRRRGNISADVSEAAPADNLD